MSYWYDNLSESAQKHYVAWQKHKREGRGMATEIRIEKDNIWTCSWRENADKSICGRTAAAWRDEDGDRIISLCDIHGQPLINALIFMKEHYGNDLTITGGYGDEPKSPLAKIREQAGKVDSSIHANLICLLDYLIVKERADGK